MMSTDASAADFSAFAGHVIGGRYVPSPSTPPPPSTPPHSPSPPTPFYSPSLLRLPTPTPLQPSFPPPKLFSVNCPLSFTFPKP